MEFKTIERAGVLNDILSTLEKLIYSSRPDIIEIVGEAGCGKTTVLDQLEQYLNYHAIFPQIISTKVSDNFTLIDALTAYAERESLSHGLNLNFNSSTYEDQIGYIQEYLLTIRDTRKDILLIILDDSHNLSDEIIKQLQQLFDPEISSPFIYLILSGREKSIGFHSISVKEFNNEETDEYFLQVLGNRWVNDYQDVYEWIKKLTGSWPYYLSLILNQCIEKGLISQGYAASLELIKANPLPKSLLEAIKFALPPQSLFRKC